MNVADHELMAFAVDVAREGGRIMRDYFSRDDKRVDIKSDKTVVTAADLEINALLIERVRERFPDHGVLGEEDTWHPERSDLWVCDPVDGTEAFIIGIPVAMFSLAFVVDGEPRIGVVYDPFQDRLITAAKGDGAQCNSKPIHVSDHSGLKGARIGTMASVRTILKNVTMFQGLQDRGARIKSTSGAVFQGSLVATGREDAYIFFGSYAHDMAAIKVIVEEAGGKVTDLQGNDQLYNSNINGAIVSNGKIHDAIVGVVRDCGPELFLNSREQYSMKM